MFLSNVSLLRREINKNLGRIRFIAKAHCNNKEIIYQTPISLKLLLGHRSSTNGQRPQDQLISEFIVASWQLSLTLPLKSKQNRVEWMKSIQSYEMLRLLWKWRWWEMHFRFGTYTLLKTQDPAASSYKDSEQMRLKIKNWTVEPELEIWKTGVDRFAFISIQRLQNTDSYENGTLSLKKWDMFVLLLAHFEFCSFQHLWSH